MNQTKLNKYSNIFDRILFLIERKGLKNVAELANLLGYGSPQKIYRLKQEEDAKPSYDMIKDFSSKFEDLNLRWFLTGDGEPFQATSKKNTMASEPEADYKVDEIQKLKVRISELEIEKKSLLLALREIGAGNASEKKSENVSPKRTK
jgi:hypothetical protein